MRARVLGMLPVLVLPATAAGQYGTPTIYVGPIVPPAFRLLAEPAVQTEVGLTEAQKTAADQIRRVWAVGSEGLWFGTVGYVPADLLRNALGQRTVDYLATGLTKEQRTRLDQIHFQLREKEFGAHMAFAMAARDLGLRRDQLDDVHSLKAQRIEEIDKSVTSGKRFEKIKTDVQATNGDTFEKMAEMLSRTQRERLKAMRGKEFVVPQGGPKPAAKVTDVPPARYSATNVGYYDLELTYCTLPSVVAELKLNETQVKALSAAWNDAAGELGVSEGRVRRGWVDTVHSRTEKVLDQQLTKQQRARFDQIMMQRRAKVSPEAICTYPAAIGTLKMTPIQLQQLSGGKRLAEVLSKDQLTAYDKLLGAPFVLPSIKDDYLPAPAPVPDPAVKPHVPYAVARDFLVLTNRLNLTEAQVKKLRELAEDEPKIRELIQKELALDDTPPVAGSGRAITTVSVVTDHYRATVEQHCWDVLEPAQQSTARKIFGRGISAERRRPVVYGG
jgi:hypothetical protein